MTQYETAFLISPNLEEEETDKVITQMAEVISKKKGKMINEDRWGKRKLAYPIQKFEEAFYVFFHYEGDPEIPSELERRFKQTESVLRYLTVKKTQKENVRRKKAAPSEKEKSVSPEEEEAKTELAEIETLDEEKKGKTQVEEKEEVKDTEEGEKEERVQKGKAAEKKEEGAQEEGDEKKEDLKKMETSKKTEDGPEDIAPPKKGKEK